MKSNNPTIVLSGYYGFDNAGDEALLGAIIAELHELRPALRVVVLSARPERTSRQYGVAAVSRNNPLAVLQALAGADLLVSGGGSLLQDVTSGRSIVYYLGVVAMAQALRKPVMYYAQGIGPIRRPWARQLARLVSNRVQLITLRDEDSRRLVDELAIGQPPIVVTADPVLSLFAGPATASRSRPRLGIALRRWQQDRNLQRAVAAAADHMAAAGWEIVYFPFHYPEDLAMARETAALMRYPSRVPDQPPGARELLAEIAGLDLLLGMRLHSLIFAAVNAVPFLGISYDPKVDAFLASLNRQPVAAVEQITAARLTAALQQLAARREQEREALTAAVLPLRRQARHTAQLLLDLLEHFRSGGGAVFTPPPLTVTEPGAAAAPDGPPRSNAQPPEPITLLGAPIHPVDMAAALRIVTGFIEQRTPHQIVTLNAEILERAQQEPELLALLNRVDLVTADGAGILWAARRQGHPLPAKVTGIDLATRLAPLAADQGWRLFLLGGEPGVAAAAGRRLTTAHPGLRLAGSHHGYFARGSAEEAELLAAIEAAAPELLLVGMGAPRQEYWLRSLIEQGRLAVPVAIGVGGSLDVLAGRVARAPRWLQRLNLEWLWRLCREPRRWRRMLALPRFVWRVRRLS